MEQTPTTAESDPTYLADLELLEKMFAKDFDWEQWWDDPAAESPEDVFRRTYKWHDYRAGDRPVGTNDCGGVKFDDTPRSLYRALFWVNPSFVDFSDMYKTGSMLDLCSPDYHFVCSLQLFKYELGAYFACAKQHIEGQPHMVIASAPGSDNGMRCRSALGNKWFDVAITAFSREWMIYGGNDFRV